jgi:putative DNA primase/helicase
MQDADGEVRRLAKLAARHRYVTAPAAGDDLQARTSIAKFAIQSENRQRLDAMLSQAQTEPPVSEPGTSWNADPWLLGVDNGVVDLRTGQLRPGRHDDRVTFHVSVRYDPTAECLRWLLFLEEVFRGDREVIDFIQRAVGYSLTGITTEQCMFLCYGRGANGKTVLLAVLRALAGDYAYNAPFSLFEIHTRSAIPNDLAALVGRRLVTSSETNEGTRLNEARVKALTGCDPITARFLHGEFFTFDPVAKYWLAVNHKPTVQDDSYGFWRRVRLIPFTREFSDGEADDGLTEALLAELSGILAWAVQGALRWHRNGLGAPAAVRTATESYRVESDPLAPFLEECCVQGEELLLPGGQAFKAYKAWGTTQGMSERELLSSRTFGSRMAMKFERKHTNRGNAYVGVGLRESEG